MFGRGALTSVWQGPGAIDVAWIGLKMIPKDFVMESSLNPRILRFSHLTTPHGFHCPNPLNTFSLQTKARDDLEVLSRIVMNCSEERDHSRR